MTEGTQEIVETLLDALERRGMGSAEALESATVRVLVGEYEWLYTVRGSSPPTIMNALAGITTALEAEGIKPAPARGQSTGGGGNGGGGITDKPPLCPKHGKPMRLTKNQKAWYCPTLVGQDEDTGNKIWCVEKIKVGMV